MADKRLTIPENMGKDQEIALIFDFFQALPQDTYLKRMLARFPAYAEQQIRDDFDMDPLETVDSIYRDISKAQKDMDEMKQSWERDVKGAAEGLKVIIAERDRFQKAAKEFEASYRENERLLNEAQDRISDLGLQLSTYKRGDAEAREIIKDLKAKLFDYITKEQAGA